VRRRDLLRFCGSALPAFALELPLALAEGASQPTAAERAAGVAPKNYAYPPLNILRYGAVGDGLTDDGAAIRAAWAVARQQGGGTILFPNGVTYLVSSLDPASPLKIPQQRPSGAIDYQPYQTQLYFQNASNVVLDFQGSTLKTPLTGGGAFIVLDGCSNIRMLRPKITGAQMMSSGVVSLGAIIGGSGYADGTYDNVRLTGGTGGGAVANIVVREGVVSAVTVVYPGGSYAVGNVLSCKSAAIGGRGSGFSGTVGSVSGAGPKLAVAAPNAILCTTLSGSSTNITLTDLEVAAMYTAFYVAGDPGSANTITHVSLLGHTRALNCEYGVALHDGGDDASIEDLYTYRAGRPFFFFGVQNVSISCVGDQNNFGFAPVVKAYSRSTRNIVIRYSAINQPGQSESVAKINFQVQHDPAVISPPPTVQHVQLEYTELNLTSGGYGVQFDYYSGPGGITPQSASSNQLFDDFLIRGSSRNALRTTVSLIGAAAQCRINADQFQFTRRPADHELAGNGFLNQGTLR